MTDRWHFVNGVHRPYNSGDSQSGLINGLPCVCIPLTGRQVVGDDIMRNVSVEDHFEAGQAVVAETAVVEDPVGLLEGVDVHLVVQHDRTRGFNVALNAGTLQEDHFRVVVRIGTHLELT